MILYSEIWSFCGNSWKFYFFFKFYFNFVKLMKSYYTFCIVRYIYYKLYLDLIVKYIQLYLDCNNDIIIYENFNSIYHFIHSENTFKILPICSLMIFYNNISLRIIKIQFNRWNVIINLVNEINFFCYLSKTVILQQILYSYYINIIIEI